MMDHLHTPPGRSIRATESHRLVRKRENKKLRPVALKERALCRPSLSSFASTYNLAIKSAVGAFRGAVGAHGWPAHQGLGQHLPALGRLAAWCPQGAPPRLDSPACPRYQKVPETSCQTPGQHRLPPWAFSPRYPTSIVHQ